MSDMLIVVRTETDPGTWEVWASGTHTVSCFADAKASVLRLASLELVGLKAAEYQDITCNNTIEDLTAGSQAYHILVTYRYGPGPYRLFGRTLIVASEVMTHSDY